jgi:hypothetical protein
MYFSCSSLKYTFLILFFLLFLLGYTHTHTYIYIYIYIYIYKHFRKDKACILVEANIKKIPSHFPLNFAAQPEYGSGWVINEFTLDPFRTCKSSMLVNLGLIPF